MVGLVGRSTEAAWLARCLRVDGPFVVMLLGLAGVGKSFLLDNLAGVAAETGWRVERIFGSPAARDVPLGAASHLIPGGRDDEPEALFRRARIELVRHARGAPLLLVVDDVHELDAWTAALVDQVAAHRDAHIAAVARTGAFSPAVSTLSARAGAETLVIDPLPRDAADVLVEELLGGPCDDDVLDELWGRCLGHPLYVEAALAEALQRGAVRRGDEGWGLAAPISSRRLDELVAGRLRQAGDDGLAAAEFIAVAGPLPLDLMRLVVPTGMVDHLVHHGLLERRQVDGSTVVALAHPLLAEACVERLTEARTREICGQLVRAVTTRAPGAAIDVVRLGALMLRSGEVDADLAVRAGNEALRRGDLALAEDLARAAGETAPGSIPAQLTLARSLAYGGRGEDALTLLARIRVADPAAAASVALVRGHVLAFGLGRADDAIRLLEETANDLPPELRWGLDGARSLYGALAGDFEAAITAASRVLANDDADDEVRLGALVNLTVARSVRGDLADIGQQVDAGLALVDSIDLPHPLAADQLAATRLNSLLAAGRLDEARREAERRLTDDASPLLLTWSGVVLGMVGQRRAAEAAERRAVEMFATADPLRLAPQAQSLLVMHRAQGGTVDDVSRSMLAAAGAAAGQETRLRCWVERAEVWCAAAMGRTAEAVDRATAVGGETVARDHVVWGVWILHDAVRLGAAGAVTDALDAAISRTSGAHLLGAMRDHARALQAGRLDDLAGVARRFARSGSPTLASEASAQAAVRHADAGDDEAARRLALLAVLWHQRCDGTPPPSVDTVADLLTPRQIEIAVHVSSGATSQAVADTLFLSVRTVDNHLRTIYGKLGLRGRDELGTLIRSAG